MITNWETNFKAVVLLIISVILARNKLSDIFGNHAVIFTGMNSPNIFSVGNVCVDDGKP